MLTELWKTKLHSYHLGSHRPIYEPQNDSIYISDGWGAFYSAIRLRRLSLADGHEIDSVLVRDTPSCLYFPNDQNTIIATLGKRIVELDRASLRVRNQWKTGVPRYSQYVNMAEKTLLLMSWSRPTLSLYDLDSSKRRHKKVGFCKGIFKIDEKEFMICTGKDGVVWRYSIDSNYAKKLINTPQFNHARLNSNKSKLILTLGNPHEISSTHVAHYPEFEKIRIYDLNDFSFQEFSTPATYEYLEVNDDCTVYYFSRTKGLDVCVVKDGKLELMKSGDLADNSQIISIIPNRSMIISATADRKESRSILNGIRFNV